MGLSSKQVSRDKHGWNQAFLEPKSPSLKKQAPNVQQQDEALKCPRCDSTNTKFCYYNNYNKSQPRHFCKACKRHWTKGGTLRNVPVGGGRKNKRLKASNSDPKAASKTVTTTTTTNNINKMLLQLGQQNQSKFNLPLGESSINGYHEAYYQTLIKQQPSSLQESTITFNKVLNDGLNLGSCISIPNHNDHQNDDHLQFPYINLGSFDSNPNNPCSISSPNFYNQANGLEETMMNSEIDMSNNWGWEDFDKFVCVEADLSMPWEETEIKPRGP
ncbi:unnamed protein product [Amaranthus hypochondriacus]